MNAMTQRSSPPIVLASQSPRRSQLLGMLGLEFDVRPADVDESVLPDETSTAHVQRLAQAKCLAVGRHRPDAYVIGSDTVVVIDGDILGKPRDEDHAVEMLLRLAGRVHRVETGVAILAPGGELISDVEQVQVRFRPLDEREAREYVATGEPMDKAGAYGIQGYGATLVEAIEGDFFAVMGLPVARMVALFRRLGLRYNFRGFETI